MSNAFDWEQEDKAMAAMLDHLPTAEEEAAWAIEIDAELDRQWNDQAQEREAHARQELAEDIFFALETYFVTNHGLGFTRTTLADFMWDIYKDIGGGVRGVL